MQSEAEIRAAAQRAIEAGADPAQVNARMEQALRNAGSGGFRQVVPDDPGAQIDVQQERRLRQLQIEEAEREAAEASGTRDPEIVRREVAGHMNTLAVIQRALGDTSGWTAGVGGAAMGIVPGTSARDLQGDIDTILGNLSFDALQAMRDASPTGGALGQVSEIELRLLGATVASLDRDMSPQRLRENLARVGLHYQNWLNAVEEANGLEPTPAAFDWGSLVGEYGESDSIERFERSMPTDEDRAAANRAELENVGLNEGTETTATFGSGNTEETARLESFVRERMNRHVPAPQIIREVREEFGLSISPSDRGLRYYEANDRGRAPGYQPQPISLPAAVDNTRASTATQIIEASSPMMQIGGALARRVRGEDATASDAAIMNFTNETGLGIPALAADRTQEMAVVGQQFPTESVVGGGAGLVAGGLGAQGAGRAAIRAIAPRLAGGGAAASGARNLAGEAGFGATVSTTHGQDPVTGAVLGPLGYAGGRAIGGGVNAARGPARSITDDIQTGRENAVAALAAEDLTPSQALARLEEGSNSGVPISVADLGPTPRSRAVAYGRSRDAEVRANVAPGVRERQLGAEGVPSQSERVRGHVERNFGEIPANRIEESRRLTDLARQRAAPLYEEAYSARGVYSPEIEQLLQRPSAQDALRRAERIMREEGLDPRAMGIDLDAQGEIILVQNPSMQTLDYVKRGLDSIVLDSRAAGNFGRLDTAGNAANQTRIDLLRELDARNPAYARARAAWAGPIRDREALEAGYNASRPQMDVDELQAIVGDLSEAERLQFQRGFATGLVRRSDRQVEGGNRAHMLLGAPERRRAIATVFGGEEGLDDFMRSMDFEGEAYQTYAGINTGSQTAERLEQASSLPTVRVAQDPVRPDGLAGDILEGGQRGGVEGAVAATASRMTRGFRRGSAERRQATRMEAARNSELEESAILGLQAPADVRSALDALRRQDAIRRLSALADARSRQGVGRVAGQIGAASALSPLGYPVF